MKLKRILCSILAIAMILSTMGTVVFADEAAASVAKVGNTEYATIDEALAAWTNNTTLTLLSDVTLSDVITINSTEHHILNLGTYTMTAASGKNAIVIKACGTGSAERYAITINADATNPGGINAGSKSVIYYKYADGGISTEDRPIIKINNGVFTGSTSSWGTAGIYTIGTAARKCATLNVSGGTFNCSINGSGKSKLIISGGTFNYSVGSQGDSTASRLISGGTFKTLGFMTADSNNTKFWFGTSMGNSNVGVHVDDNGYIVVGGPVVTEAGETYEASSANYSGASSYLQYSSAKDNGLYYTSVEEALADNNKTTDSVTVYVDELDMTGISYKGTIVVPDGEEITIIVEEGTTPAWTVTGSTAVTYTDAEGNVLEKSEDGTFVGPAAVAKIGDTEYETLEDAFKAAVEGNTITLLDDVTPALTSQSGITKASVIDLNGKTLTLTEDDLYFGTTTFKNGNIIVDSSVRPSTAVFWMFANQTLTFDNVKLTATGVTGTYLIGLDGNNSDLNLLNGSEIIVENDTALDLDIICVNASTGNDILIENSKVKVSNLDGRVFFRGNYTVSGNSDIDLSGITKAGFRIEEGQTLNILDNATVDIVGEPRDGGIHLTDLSAVYNKADTAVVNSTLNKPAKPVAKIGDTGYEDLQEAIKAAAPNGTVEIISDIVVDKWIMFSQRLSIGSGQIITLDMNGITINGNDHTLTVNSIESATNGGRLFHEADNLNINNLTIKYADGVVGGISLKSGTIEDVTFEGGVGVLPGEGDITITGCTFKTSGSAIYNETDRDKLVVTNNNFKTAEGQYAIYLRGGTTFTDNTVVTGKVNVVNGSPVVTGNNFGDERFKVYNGATATIENNTINVLAFNDESKVNSVFSDNTLSVEAQAVLEAATTVAVVKDAEGNVIGKYADLSAAIKAANAGETVTISAGEFDPINISNKNITIQGTVGDNGELLTTIKGGNPSITGHSFNGTIKDLKIGEGWKVMYAEPAGNVTVDNVYVTKSMYGFHLIASSPDLTWTIQNSYMNLQWANSFGVYGSGDAAILIKGNEFVSTDPYYEDYGAYSVNTFLPNVTVEENIFRTGTRIFVDASVGDTSNIIVRENYHEDGYENAFPNDSDGIVGEIQSYYKNVDENGNLTELTYVPRGDDFTGYTNETSIWGEVWGNARESFEIKILDADGNVMGTTSLNNIDGIIDGDLKVTWNIKLDAESNTDDYWTMSWSTAPTIDTMPAKVELWVDGTKVSGGNVVLNSPDDIYPVFAAKTDENGKILGYIRCSNSADVNTTLASAISDGDNIAILVPGTYAVPTGKNITVTGAVDGVVFDNIGACGLHADATFNNVTFDYYPNVDYTGLQHSGNLVYNDCTFNGQVFLYGTSEIFNNCTFNQESSDAYNVWTYDAKVVEFNGCTFNSAGKSVLIYHEGENTFNDVTVNDCDFVASVPVEGKAAIEMDSSLTAGIKLTIDAETTATGFGTGNKSGNSLWNNKKGNEGDNNDITVTVNGETVLAPMTYVAQIGDVKYTSLADAAANASAGDTITLLADVTFDDTVELPAGITLNGNGFTINGSVKAGGDLTFEGHTTIHTFSAGWYNNTITIGEGASLEITGGRMTVSYGNIFNIKGNVENAKTTNKENITPSLKVVSGLSFNGDGAGTSFNVENAYVIIGDSTTKNSGATGEFNINFTNSIADFTKTLKTYEPTVSGLNPVVNLNWKDSVVSVASHLEFWRAGTNVTLDNTDLTVGGSFANAGTVNVINGSNFVVKAPIMSSHGGNTGTIFIDDSVMNLIDSNQDWENAGTFKITADGKLIANDFKCVDNGVIVIDAKDLAAGTSVTVVENPTGDDSLEGKVTVENGENVTVSYDEKGSVTIKKAEEPDEVEILDPMIICNMDHFIDKDGVTYMPIHFYAGIDSLNYKEVGYEYSIKNTATGKVVDGRKSTTKVYTSMKVTQTDGTVKTTLASELGGAYMFGQAFEFNSIDWNNDNTEITIKAYALKLDGKTYEYGPEYIVTDAVIKSKNPNSALFREGEVK